MIKFTWATTALAGRIVTSIIVAERTRWVDSNPNLDAAIRKDLLEGPFQPGGLFKGALERMALAVEEQRPGCEALITFAPPRPPRNQPRDFLPRQVQRQASRQAPRQYPGGGGGARQPQRTRQGRDDGQRAPPRASSADARDRRPPRPADQRRRPPAAPAGAKKGANKSTKTQQKK